MSKLQLIQGDCLDKLKELADNSVDSIVTDPPYELGFMGKSWDNTGIANNKEMWAECLRVLKPGGHLLSFGGTRTYHRMASAIEDAGFEVRDMIEWVYGSGFPKSQNIGKMYDKKMGNEREIVGDNGTNRKAGGIFVNNNEGIRKYTKGSSPYEGLGTALKPAHEPICMARKPLSEKTVVDNVIKWGTGGINIDGCRVGTKESTIRKSTEGLTYEGWGMKQGGITGSETGRFPANLIHDGSDEVVGLFPNSKSVASKRGGATNGNGKNIDYGDFNEVEKYECGFSDSGNASRFFYCAKASKSERNFGCEGKEEIVDCDRNPECYSADVPFNRSANPKKNNHPTVKPIKLMEYLIKLVTKENAVVLDPFLGSGTTAIACLKLNRKFIGIEKEEEYVKIAQARIKPYLKQIQLNSEEAVLETII